MPWIPVVLTAAVLIFLYQNQQACSVKLGKYYTLAELTNTSQPFDNTPTPEACQNLKHLVANVLDPLREKVGPVIITSGYRSPEVNAAVGGSNSSQHMSGNAVDVRGVTASNEDIVEALSQLPVDQVITYYDSGHVHISSKSSGNRGEFLYKGSEGYEWMA